MRRKFLVLICVRYRGLDRTIVSDRHDYSGNLIEQIDAGIQFVMDRQQIGYRIDGTRRGEILEYPLVALREGVINAIMHRDYFYQDSSTILSMYADRIEIENPGGLIRGVKIEDLGRVSVRRNSLIANLLLRAGYVESLGSGINRIRTAIEENGNPPISIEATNCFRLTVYAREALDTDFKITDRQQRLAVLFKQGKSVTKGAAAEWLGISDDSALRDLRALLEAKLIRKEGVGKSTRYYWQGR